MAANDVQGILQSNSALFQSAGYVKPYFEGEEHVQKVFASSTLFTDQNVTGHWR